jgi:fucose permease
LLSSQLGPALAELANRTSSTLAEVGAIFTALFLGALLTQSAAGPASDRIGERPVLLTGLGLVAAGMTGVALSRTLPLLLACTVVAGLGFGFLTVGTNVLVARAFVQHSVSALNLTNLFYGLGAVAGPVLGSLAVRTWRTGLPALWFGIAMTVLLIPAVYLSSAGRLNAGHAARSEAAARRSGLPALYRSRLLWMLSAMLLVYVGVETAVGGWTATYLQATASYRLEAAALVVSGYWLALTAGRLVNSWLGIRLTADHVLLLSLGGAVAAACLIVASTGHAALTIAGVLLLGFSFGAIFPTGLAIITGAYAPAAGKAASVAQMCGSLGGMTLPWLMGLVLVGAGPTASMVCVAAGAIGMLLLYLGARRMTAQPAAFEAATETISEL